MKHLLSITVLDQWATPWRIDLGAYRESRSLPMRNFVVEIDARPLVCLLKDAAEGLRVVELLSLCRPGELLNYLWVSVIELGERAGEDLAYHRNRFVPDSTDLSVPFTDFDARFRDAGEDTRKESTAWLAHCADPMWRDRLNGMMAEVKLAQQKLREGADFLTRRVVDNFDIGRHAQCYAAKIERNCWLRGPLEQYETIPVPPRFVAVLAALIQRDDVHSVACPFKDIAVWRILVERQLREGERTGLPLEDAFFLCGPDGDLYHVPLDDWGCDVHIPYEGITGADLFIVPEWFNVRPEKAAATGRLSSAIGGRQCHHVLSVRDYGEISGATRTMIDDCYLYTSAAQYQDCHPWRQHESSDDV